MSVHPGPLARWVVAAVLLGFGPVGCGGGASTVRGQVTLNAKPLVWGTVILVDSTGQYHQGDIDLNGRYEIDNVPAGAVKIAVVSLDPDHAARGRGDPKTGKAGGRAKGSDRDDPRDKFLAEQGGKKLTADRPRPPAGAWFPIPPRYRTPEESGLSGEVKGKDAILNIDLR
jgi:hypothetical protein